MESKELQHHLFRRAKDVADSHEFEIHSFAVDGDLVDVSWRGFDTQGNAVELTHVFDLSLIKLAISPKAAIEEEVFICEKIIEEALSDGY